MIQVRHLHKSFNGQQVLEDINLQVKKARSWSF